MNKFLEIITSEKIYLPVVYILLGLLVSSIVSKIIKKIVGKVKVDKRKNTIINLSKSIVRYSIFIFVILGILKIYGIDTTSIIASLGVFAAVIGLAFQDILKDLLAGIAIIFDNKYAVGDVVEINGFTGTVISLGLRSTKIKAFSGEVKCIGNSSFNEVVNYNLADTDLFIKLDVAYDTDLDKLDLVLNNLKQDIIKLDNVKDYEVLGIDSLASSSVVYMVNVKCKATTGAGVKRKVLRIIKDKFDEENINIPYTTVDINVRK